MPFKPSFANKVVFYCPFIQHVLSILIKINAQNLLDTYHSGSVLFCFCVILYKIYFCTIDLQQQFYFLARLHFQGNKTELYSIIPHITTNNTDLDSSEVVLVLIKTSHRGPTQMSCAEKNV